MYVSLTVAASVTLLYTASTSAFPSRTPLQARQATTDPVPVAVADGLSYVVAPPAASGSSSPVWQAAFERAQGLVDQMTLEEQAS